MDQVIPTTRKKSPKSSAANGAALKAANGQAAKVPLPGIQVREGTAVDEAQAREILAALRAFAGGDFSARLPVTWVGTDGRIAEAFNQSITNAQRVTSEAARLSTTVGKEGRLSQRISSPGATGGWADQVDSLNTLIDDL